MLSHPPVQDKGETDNSNLTLLPPSLFVNAAYTLNNSWPELCQKLIILPHTHQALMEAWAKSEKASLQEGLWLVQGCIVVPPNDKLKRAILHQYHNAPTAGHPGRDRTIEAVRRIL